MVTQSCLPRVFVVGAPHFKRILLMLMLTGVYAVHLQHVRCSCENCDRRFGHDEGMHRHVLVEGCNIRGTEKIFIFETLRLYACSASV